MVKILVVDDHAVVRQGIIQILEDVPELYVAGEASTGQEALQAIRQNAYDIVLLDIALTDMNGLEVLHQIRDYNQAQKVLILSMYPEKQYATRMLKAGAAGYLTKESAPTELVTALQKVSWGGKYVTRSLAEHLVTELSSELEKPPHEYLSDREYQVMCLLAEGKTSSEIAAELLLSAKTISTYRKRILEKLDMKNTAEIIRYALQQGLVE